MKKRLIIPLTLVIALIFAPPGSAVAGLAGDLNGDGIVSVFEVQAVINAFLGVSISTVTPGNNLPGDLNGSGGVSLSEVQAVINAFLSSGPNNGAMSIDISY